MLGPMRPAVPPEIDALAMARSRARMDRRWDEADRLRGEIEAAGWRIVDTGTAYDLRPAHASTIVADGRVRYGRAEDVPSRLDDAAVGLASVVVVATDRPDELERCLSGLREHAPDGVQVVVVGDAPSAGQEIALDELEAVEPGGPGLRTEVVRTSAPVGVAAALNAGLRRAEAAIVVVLDPGIEAAGDIVSPLRAALDDPGVAVAGAFGIDWDAGGRFRDAGTGVVGAVDADCLAFRRSDFVARGPFDEGFRTADHLGTWWSIVLRDEGPGHEPRQALALELPLVRREAVASSRPDAQTRDRLARRNRYRVLDRLRASDVLLAGVDADIPSAR
jgi:Glycosyl transferase family 2